MLGISVSYGKGFKSPVFSTIDIILNDKYLNIAVSSEISTF